jgi:cation diffusion facilitator family transporter
LAAPSLTRFAWLSIGAALTTMALKAAAYLLTGSVGLLSDAMESLVNLAGALMALSMLTVAARPADDDHPHGHGKAEYFSAGVEGTLIMIAAASIAYAAVQRLLHPKVLEQLGLGLAVSVLASLVNLVVALVLLRASRAHRSATLRANAHHLLTDVWTSAGVLVGVGLVAVTGWQKLDPIVAIGVALNIVWTGGRIVRESVYGLMDAALPPQEQALVKSLLEPYVREGVQYHALRTRQSGAHRFVSLHVLVPPLWTVQQGHDLLERIEADIRRALPPVSVLTHLEPLGDPAAMNDLDLHRDERD